MTANMEGPFMGNVSGLDAAFDMFGSQAMAFSAVGSGFDSALSAQEDFDFGQYFNNQQFVFELDPDGAETFDLPFPLNDYPALPNEQDSIPCQLLNTENSLKRGLDDDDELAHDDDDHPDDHPDDLRATSPKPRPKRLKAIKGGYPCTHCTKTFNRAADLNKHEHRAHATDDEKPCACSRCDKRFLYPKDVVRHNRQIHGVFDQLLQRITTAAASSHPRPAALLQHDADGKSSFMTLSTALVFSRSIVMLKGRLRLRRKSSVDATVSPVTPTAADHRYVLLTTNKRDFRAMDVAQVATYDALLKAVREELQLPSQNEILVHRYYLGSDVDLPMNPQQTMNMLAKDADPHGTLKLYLTVVKAE